ncbi:MAG: M24 family metallopeptidase [Anaerolineae bacterium]
MKVSDQTKNRISVQEYRTRLQVTRQAMARMGLDALLVYSWKRSQVRYLSGYKPNYVANVAMLIVLPDEDPILLVRFPFDLERARKVSWLQDIQASGDLEGLVRDCQAILENAIPAGSLIGLVGGDSVVNELPHQVYEMLNQALPGHRLVSAPFILEQARMRKSTAEAELVHESARVADATLAAARSMAQAGRSEYEIIAAAEATARTLGAEEILSVIASAAWELIRPPEARTLGEDEMLVAEFAVQVGGYFTQVPGVFHTGMPSAEQREMYSVAYAGYLAGVQATCPGHTIGDVAKAELAVLEDSGWLEWHAYDLGHGDGLDHPEVPAITPESDVPIEPGMVLCIHPGLRKPGVGGVFVGGTVLVEQDGAIPLNQVAPEL